MKKFVSRLALCASLLAPSLVNGAGSRAMDRLRTFCDKHSNIIKWIGGASVVAIASYVLGKCWLHGQQDAQLKRIRLGYLMKLLKYYDTNGVIEMPDYVRDDCIKLVNSL